MLSIFSCASWPSVCLLWRNVYLGLLLIFWLGFFFFFLILSCMSCLCILEINPLSIDLFANIFSHSEGCFILFTVSFAVQKLLSFIWSQASLVAQWLRIRLPMQRTQVWALVEVCIIISSIQFIFITLCNCLLN